MNNPVFAMGIDAGFRKTGVALFSLNLDSDVLICVDTLETSNFVYPDPLNRDVSACWNLFTNVEDVILKHKPEGIFIEMPHGGGQGARPHRCMGMATAVITCLIRGMSLQHEMLTPTEVEKALGIYITPKDARAAGIPKGKTGKYKKEKQKLIAINTFPDFSGWPEAKTKAEDAYDATCAFIAARKRGSPLYNKLKEKVRGRTTG